MNLKFILLFLVAVILAIVVLVKLPSKADTQVQLSPKAGSGIFAPEKVTDYSNGILKIKPQNFAVSRAVKDMPTEDPDGLLKSVLYETKQQKEEALKEAMRKQGISEEEIKEKEINQLNVKVLKKLVPGAGADKGDGKFQDPLVNKEVNINAPQAMPTPSLSFNGATQADNASQGIGNRLPPDPNGDVGPNHYVSSVNVVLKMFNKSGEVVAGPIKTSALFATLPDSDPCRVQNDGDPIVLYDTLADRWHVSQFAMPAGNIKYQCVALSVTGDPTGAFYAWSYAYANSKINDFPKVGVWTDAYHMTFSQLDTGTRANLGLGVLSQDRHKALVGDPNAAAIYYDIGGRIEDLNTGGALPSDIDGFVAPPEGMAEVIAEFQADEFSDPVDGLRFYKWVPNFSNPANSSLSVLPDSPMTAFDARNPPGRDDIEQQDGTNLDSISDRLMHRFAYRNFGTTANPINSYAGNFTVNVSGVPPNDAATYQAAIRWFEIRRVNDTFSVYDEGTHNLSPNDGANGLNNWMGSVAQDHMGNFAVGFSQSGTNQNADIKIAGRTNNVPNSRTLNEGEALFYDATGSQTSTGSRWGDYSSMSIDPSDDCTFWYTQEYYAVTSSSNWLTRVGKFKFPQCTAAPKATITGTITICNSSAPVSNASVDATGGFNRVTGANGTYSMTVSPGTYTVRVSKTGAFASSPRTVTIGAGQTVTADICLTGPTAISQSGEVQIVSENCGAANGAVDPGETITVSLPLQNTGSAGTTNLTATLQGTGGVTNPGPAQNYGALLPGNSPTIRNFTFKADPNLPCGSTITLTFVLTDGATNYGTITKTFTIGVRALTLKEGFDAVESSSLPAGWTNVVISGSSNWITSNAAFASGPEMPGATALVSPSVLIQGTDSQISFKNSYNTETSFDGMVLEYSTNDGSTWVDIVTSGGSFASGGYNSFLQSETGNPIGNRQAWTGDSDGYINTVVNLPAALNGQNVRFRWVLGTDDTVAGAGVWIDDVQIFGSIVCNTECSGPVSCNFKRRFDFSGDAKADISVFRPSDGYWHILNSQSGVSATQFGAPSDTIVPTDYDGDNKTDLAVYRSGTWYLQRSTEGFTGVAFGEPTDIPQPADFTGDGKAELAVFRPSNGTWYIYNLTNNQISYIQFGQNGDKPVVGDYDGDCKADAAVYRNGIWYLQKSTTGFAAIQFGDANDKLVPADYDGDGKTDVAVFRPSNGIWYMLQSQSGFTGIQFGQNGDKPVPADYDGDNKADVAVYRNGVWYAQRSTAGFLGVQFGDANDTPVPNAFVR